MRKNPLMLAVTTFSGACLLGAGAAVFAEYPIAGVNPAQRPQGAPVIAEVKKVSAWYENALAGVTKPYPETLKFLEDQGNWYTPFDRPGMPGRYDIRGRHVK